MPVDSGAGTPAFIGIGSNLSSPRTQVAKAIDSLSAIHGTRLAGLSSLYRSAPFRGMTQPDFINAVAELSTDLDARSLFRELQQIEDSQGRIRAERWGPRVIDLDLLVYGTAIIRDADLTVPHPGIADRNFVLLPLQEIAPDLEIPGLGPVADLAVDTSEPRITRLD
jgi:2-amino-4-hydroxy-6-hydroxymethyldihydropteridine diphosphokinase